MKNIIKYLDYIIYWSIVLIPFSIAIAPAPANVFMAFLIVAFLTKKILKKEYIFSRNALSMPLVLLFIITCISAFNSINIRDSLKGGILRLLQYIFIFFIVAEEIKNQRHIKNIFLFICLGIVLASGDAIVQVLSGKDFIRGYKPIINIGLVRATASFKDSNLLGIYLSAFAPLVFGLAFYYFKTKERIAFIFVSLIALIGIILTYSRPTLLAIYIAIFFLSIANNDKLKIILLIALLAVSPFILPKSVKNWAKEVNYNPIRFMCNDDRIAVYRNSIHMINAHPIIGVGANAYMNSYKKYKEFPEYRGVVTLDAMKAHNNFLHMAAEIGLVGLTIFIWLLFKLFIEIRRIYRILDEPYLKVTLLSLSACLIAFLVNGLTESSLYYSRVALIFWYMAGFSLSLRKFINVHQSSAG